MTTPITAACQRRHCQRFFGTTFDKDDHPMFICEAFPGGIPLEIVTGENDHTSPMAGDDGLLFLPPLGGSKSG